MKRPIVELNGRRRPAQLRKFKSMGWRFCCPFSAAGEIKPEIGARCTSQQGHCYARVVELVDFEPFEHRVSRPSRGEVL